MSDVQFTISIPEDLVERAQSVGVQMASLNTEVVALLEAHVTRKAAGQRLAAIVKQIDQLPDTLKPTPDEIAEEIRTYRAEKNSPTGATNS